MTLSNVQKTIAVGVLSTIAAIVPAAAFAQSPATNASASNAALAAFKATTSAVADARTLSDCETKNGVTGSLQDATLAQIQAVGDCEINTRNIYLQAYETRVDQMPKVSSTTQATLEANLQANLSTLASIKTTLDADTSTTTAFADVQTITRNVRVFALVLPKTRITADASRQTTVSGTLQGVDAKLITKNNSASSSVQAENAPLLADITAQLAAIASSTSNALSTILPLVPDQGDKAVFESNNAAIQSAEGMIKSGTTDIQSIWNDIKQIRLNFKG